MSKHILSFIPDLGDPATDNKSVFNDAVNYVTDEGERRFERSHHHTSSDSLEAVVQNTRLEEDENQPLIGFESE